MLPNILIIFAAIINTCLGAYIRSGYDVDVVAPRVAYGGYDNDMIGYGGGGIIDNDVGLYPNRFGFEYGDGYGPSYMDSYARPGYAYDGVFDGDLSPIVNDANYVGDEVTYAGQRIGDHIFGRDGVMFVDIGLFDRNGRLIEYGDRAIVIDDSGSIVSGGSRIIIYDNNCAIRDKYITCDGDELADKEGHEVENRLIARDGQILVNSNGNPVGEHMISNNIVAFYRYRISYICVRDIGRDIFEGWSRFRSKEVYMYFSGAYIKYHCSIYLANFWRGNPCRPCMDRFPDFGIDYPEDIYPPSIDIDIDIDPGFGVWPGVDPDYGWPGIEIDQPIYHPGVDIDNPIYRPGRPGYRPGRPGYRPDYPIAGQLPYYPDEIGWENPGYEENPIPRVYDRDVIGA